MRQGLKGRFRQIYRQTLSDTENETEAWQIRQRLKFKQVIWGRLRQRMLKRHRLKRRLIQIPRLRLTQILNRRPKIRHRHRHKYICGYWLWHRLRHRLRRRKILRHMQRQKHYIHFFKYHDIKFWNQYSNIFLRCPSLCGFGYNCIQSSWGKSMPLIS